MTSPIKTFALVMVLLAPTAGGCAEGSVDKVLAGSIIVDAATDTYYNVEILRRLDAGDIDGAKSLIRGAICSDQVEMEQLQHSNHISPNARQMAERAIEHARQFRTKDAKVINPPLCVPAAKKNGVSRKKGSDNGVRVTYGKNRGQKG